MTYEISEHNDTRRPKVMGDVKPKKAKEDHGSLYMRIEVTLVLFFSLIKKIYRIIFH